MLKLPVTNDVNDASEQALKDVGLYLQFENEGDCFFKTEKVAKLDEEVGDISTHMKDLEAHLVRHLETELLTALPALRAAQGTLAELDCLLSLASCARDLNLKRPTLTKDSVLHVRQGWHPLVQRYVPQFVPNDCSLGISTPGDSESRLILLTGPNASGKTVYLRTMALITVSFDLQP